MDLAAHVGSLSVLGALPERQFLNYAWPCLDSRAGHGQQVSQDHLGEISSLLRTDARPRRGLLRYVFPDAYRGIGRAAEALGVDRWTQAAVEKYFLVDHEMHLQAALARGVPPQVIAPCRVAVGRVISNPPQEWYVAIREDDTRRVFNPLGLPFQSDNHVAVHGLAVVDVLRCHRPREGSWQMLQDMFVSKSKVRALVRDVLKCGCPETVFDDIRIGLPGLYGTHHVPEGLEFLVGGRLLVAVVPYDQIVNPTADVLDMLRLGQEVRDQNGFNRYRLVLVGRVDPAQRRHFEEFVAELDEKMHVHILEQSKLTSV